MSAHDRRVPWVDRVLLRLLPPSLRAEHSDEVAEHMVWLRESQLKRMGPFSFWLFVWADFTRVAVSGRPVVRRALPAVLLVAITLFVSLNERGPFLPDVDIRVVVESADGTPGRFSASFRGGELSWRTPAGDWRSIRRGIELDMPSEFRLRGKETRLTLTRAAGSPEVRLRARTADGGATLLAEGPGVTLERTRTRIGVKTHDWVWPWT